MKNLLAALIFGFLSTVFANTAQAQQPLACQSFDNFQVPYIKNFQLNNVGMAGRDNMGNPYIVINPNILNQFSPLTKQFWFAHECGHHALYPQQNSEPNADCFAVKSLRSIGMMTSQQDINVMLGQISQLPGSYQTGHLPGPARAQNMYWCLTQP